MQLRSNHKTTRFGLYSTEPITLVGLHSAFEGHPTISVVTGDFDTLIADDHLKYLILDLGTNPVWMELQNIVRRMRPDIRQILLVPAGNEELILQSIRAGARACLDSSCGPFALRQAAETVMEGSIWASRKQLSKVLDRLMSQKAPMVADANPTFSPRERQVLDLIMTACSNREIAEELGIEERTVKSYVASLMRKTGVDNRVSLSVRAVKCAL